jgi:hypothetical protein
MKSGVIAEAHGTGNVNDFYETVTPESERFDELEQCVEVTENIQLSDGREAQLGRAAIQDLNDIEDIHIDEGTIRRYEAPEKVTLYTDFLYVPDSFITVSSGSGIFAFNLIDSKFSISIDMVEFDLDDYVEQHPDADPWKIGFYDRIGNAENGVVHGEQLLKDSNVGDVLGTSKKNQVGLEYNFEGHLVKTFVVQSGYVDVYQPSNFETSEFVNFVETELLPHAIPK